MKLAGIERSNLLNMLKISIKGLIDSSMRLGRTLTDDHPQLQQFLILMEHTFKHRLKSRRSILGQKRSFWGAIEAYEKDSTEFFEGVANVRGIPGVKTLVGRGRAWIRFVLMQKKLADSFRLMIENTEKLSEWYDGQSVLMCEEGVVISGLLMGLNAIDYNVLIRGEDFDKSVGVLDLSQYLRDGNYLKEPNSPELDEAGGSELAKLLDQKAYLEELNKKLEGTVDRQGSRLATLESENTSLREQVALMNESLSVITLEREGLRTMNEHSSAQLRKALENLQDDQRAELATYVQTRAGLNELYSASQRSLDTEQKLRHQLEQEVELQRSIRQEKETALQLLEKSVHEKQDTVIALRKQLEETKAANLKMNNHLKTIKETHQKDSVRIKTLEGRLSQLTAHSKANDKSLAEASGKLSSSQRTARELGSKLEEVQLARSTAEADLAIEKQWRVTLQMEIQREKNRVVELTNETKKFNALKKETAALQERYSAVQETVSEQEMAMVEMGRQLSLSQQKVSDMKEVSSIMKESVWVEDKSIVDCKGCNKPFSVSRRKHHCRSCGGVFCHTCSENSMQLASSSKPVRVCDSCYSMLLEHASKHASN